MSSKTEIEVKIRHKDHAGLVVVLEEKGAVHVGDLGIMDTYYDNGHLIRSGHFIRIRIKSDGSVCFTHKAPAMKISGDVKHRPEEEFDVSDLAAVTRVMAILGVQPVLKVNKEQKRYRYKEADITLDVVEGLGSFVEIEADTEELIKELMEELGLKGSPIEQLGYAQLMAKKQAADQHRR